ncbi:uncharacterized protein E0L32_006870 [Thyridium curvatum]|uniref:Uncharacterized protein n=1 Tax=Thyridium curvatum TaxID=1093900 RepID=A0A507B6J2_9PEZI|nr:uncharacterized protein E0L32_006870 [Thyridium curvatum]TPX12458.1 hypothetical protein E0L32_006870 [Thyridium curvatum]
MLSTRSLGSFKGILPSIHHPLPLNQREAQQLLNSLTASFRKHLDKEHGWLTDDPAQPVPSRPPTGLIVSTSSKDAHRRPTDRHLRAILSNPLFSYDRTVQQGFALGQLGSAERDPMDIFVEAVSKGLMDPRRAAGCLQAKRREILQSPCLSVKDAMATPGAGLKVVQWLRSSGMERDLSFVSHTGLTSLLLKFMVAEGLEDIAWGWLDRLMRGEGPADVGKNHQPAASFVLDQLVTAKTLDATNLNEAYALILQGQEMFRSNPKFELSFVGPWRHLSWISTVEAWKRANPSVKLYESFVAISDRMRKNLRIDKAHLNLHHPTKPNPALAIQLLENQSIWQNLFKLPTSEAGEPSKRASGLATRIMSIGLDTVQYLTQSGQTEEAQHVLDLLRTNLSGFFGKDPPEFSRILATG